MDLLVILGVFVVAVVLLKILKKLVFKVITIGVVVLIVLHFFTDINLTIPW